VAPGSKFSRSVTIEPWPEGGLDLDLQANAAERRALAARFELLELRRLRGRGRLERGEEGREIRFRGLLEAEVVQPCVVSLEPVASVIAEPVERRYRPVHGGVPAPAAAPFVDPDEVEVEPLAGTAIDLGEVLAEELALALDAYPRVEDPYARLPDLGPDVTIGPAQTAASPFAVLQELHQKRAR
jgi:hypothetical protein